jgi:hypothetical protein
VRSSQRMIRAEHYRVVEAAVHRDLGPEVREE